MSTKIFFFSSVFLFFSLSSIAQDSAYNQLDNVVVTANKFEQKQNTTGKVVTVISKEQIEQSGGKTLSQILNEQAGVVVNGALSNKGSVQSVYVRGAASGRTLILLDGIPVNDPSMIGNEADLNLFSLQNIERIEICKGAQSTLYGSDAVAGVINLVTVKSDSSSALQGNATIGAGNYGTWKGNAQLYGSSGRLSYNARYAKLYTNGFSSAADTAHQHFDKDGYNGDVWSGHLSFKATDKLVLKGFVQQSMYKTDVDAGAFADDKDFSIHNNSLLLNGGFQYTSNAIRVAGNVQYNEMKRRFLNDSTDVPSYLIFEKNQYFSKTKFAELYASLRLGAGFTLLAGVDTRWGSMHSLSYSKSYFAPDYYTFTSSFPDTSVSQSSVYASLQYSSPNNRLNVELGGRLNHHSRYGANETYTFNPSYKLTDRLRVFGSVASGFKAPTLYQLYSPYGNTNLQPETSVNYEAGLQWQEKIANARVVYFYRHISSGLDFDNIQYIYFNNVKQLVRGVETELSLQPAKGLHISANYTLIAAGETTQERTAFAKDTTYHYLLRRPKHSINATVSYRFGPQFLVSVSEKTVSSRYDAAGYGVPDVKLGSYSLLSAYAEWKMNGHIKWFADAQNMFNQKFYDVYGFSSIPFLLTAGATISW